MKPIEITIPPHEDTASAKFTVYPEGSVSIAQQSDAIYLTAKQLAHMLTAFEAVSSAIEAMTQELGS